MEVLKFALEIEKEGSRYYASLAKQPPVKELGAVFELLAKEEQAHYDLFASWKKSLPRTPRAGSDILGRVKDVFKSLAPDFSAPDVMPGAEEAYRKALELERKSIAFYTEARLKADAAEHKMLFAFLIHEEKKHARLMEDLIEFVRRPREWLENAEFNHPEEY